MTFDDLLAQVIELLQREGRVSYRALKRRFALDDDNLEDLKTELIKAKRLAADEDGDVLVWTGTLVTAAGAVREAPRVPRAHTPHHLAEKILSSKTALEGERKQVTVPFADLKGSMELLADRDPEEARQLLDPVLERMMTAVHQYEGTVDQVMGDGIMALFGAPIAHEDHAVRACYTALAMQASVKEYAAEVQRTQGVPIQMRVALMGEPGVGKSRLVCEVVHSHRTRDWRVLESASASYGKATPYFPVVDLLKRYTHVDDGDNARTIRAKVTGQLLTLDEALQDAIPPVLALLDALPDEHPFLALDPPQRRQRTLTALKRVLLRESQAQPVLVVFEDLHWIDAETQALLDSLVESLPTARPLLLVNYRPEYQHGWGSKTYYAQLRLDPLPPAGADEFLQALLGDDPSLAPLKPLLIAHPGQPLLPGRECAYPGRDLERAWGVC
jgi:class 3 adenylate cyclase